MKRVTHKYGIEIPKDRDHAIAFDRINNGNTLWQDALAREMTNVSVAFLKYYQLVPSLQLRWK